MTRVRMCEHVESDDGLVSLCRPPGRDEKWVHCPCCGIPGVADNDDDLSDPMVCPYCAVAAITGRRVEA